MRLNYKLRKERGLADRLIELSKIIIHIVLLYIIFRVGIWIENTLNLIIPGSVVGMIILFILLMTNVLKLTWIKDGASFVVNNLAFFFVPAIAGVVNYLDLFKGNGFWLIIIVLLSTFLVMLSSSLISQKMMAGKEKVDE